MRGAISDGRPYRDNYQETTFRENQNLFERGPAVIRNSCGYECEIAKSYVILDERHRSG